MGRVFIESLLDIKCGDTIFGIGSKELALHDIKFLINLWKSAFRLNQNQAVHAIRDMIHDGTRRAMVDEKSGRFGLEGEDFFFARIHRGERGTSARSIYCVNVDIVRLGIAFGVGQMEFNAVSHAKPCHRTGNGSAKTPETIFYAFSQFSNVFLGFQINYNGIRSALYGGRNVGGRSQFRRDSGQSRSSTKTNNHCKYK